MHDECLDAIRVTAERVQRFASDVDVDTGSASEARERWRAALGDLRDLIRHARVLGIDPALIHHAALGVETQRFARLAAERGAAVDHSAAA